MTSLREYIANRYGTQRHARPRTALRHMREDVGDVSVLRSAGLDRATIALPGGIDLEDRAARMNDFWKALVEFQDRDVFVVAFCLGEE